MNFNRFKTALLVFILFLFCVQATTEAKYILAGCYRGEFQSDSGGKDFVKMKISSSGLIKIKRVGAKKWYPAEFMNAAKCGYYFFIDRDWKGQEFIGWLGRIDVAPPGTLWGYYDKYDSPESREVRDRGAFVFLKIKCQ